MALVQKGVFSCPHDPAPDIPPVLLSNFLTERLSGVTLLDILLTSRQTTLTQKPVDKTFPGSGLIARKLLENIDNH